MFNFYRIDRVLGRIIFLFYLLNFNLNLKSVHRTLSYIYVCVYISIYIYRYCILKVIHVERFGEVQVMLDMLIKQL